ncbi:T9SS type A sorting domain-containing protein [Chryseobacterium caseinilyticum]|uniref:T9SS type A sorting domain-containing protein n=1 Tax=Chryseobacterium caseinilyticum TaxID=2771428 RepID=A0ABR8ZAW3_9FLAO|nr:T9SS type A sorting domain-containing protein [Chryseobacterium caseinilyticum]MBD8082045.1 T9SS type A sorting domain-containing protein [Chryseobacterium caseinilyticum]
MERKITFLMFAIPVLGFSQSAIGSINSGALSGNDLAHSVGEIYVIPSNPDDAASGTMGLLQSTTVQLLGISEAVKDNIKVYPNPTADFIYIKLESKTKVHEFEIYDIAGRIVLKGKIDSEKLDLRHLKEGNYMIKFKNTDIKAIKIIKKH